MSERPKKRLVEFIESYWTGGEHGPDYIWNDNHGELVRCKDCKHYRINTVYPGTNLIMTYCAKTGIAASNPDWFCADGERR